MTPVLATARLTLRPRLPGDAAALFPTMADPAAMRWWSHAPVASIAELDDRFAGEAAGWRRWIVTRSGEDRAIGLVDAGEKRQGGVTEIGYLIATDAGGQGYAREAVTAVIDRLFAEGQRRVCADTDPDNVASNRLLEALGFRREGLLRGEWATHIGVRDSVIWGLLRGDWRCG